MRFRPIIMTSFAFILGVFPLVFATGAGAASRQSLGTAVCGGMITSTVLAVFFVPIFYVAFQSLIELINGPALPVEGGGHGHAPAVHPEHAAAAAPGANGDARGEPHAPDAETKADAAPHPAPDEAGEPEAPRDGERPGGQPVPNAPEKE
jgi:HAE1 family hydrophobic/amphiphilic exporter-1